MYLLYYNFDNLQSYKVRYNFYSLKVLFYAEEYFFYEIFTSS